MTPVLCYYSVQTSGLKVAMRIRMMFLLFSSKPHILGGGGLQSDEGLFTGSVVPRHPSPKPTDTPPFPPPPQPNVMFEH